MSSKDVLTLKRPKLFKPSVTRIIGERRGSSTDISLSTFPMFDETNIGSSSSFRYDTPGSGFKSTQEMPVNWSKLENHTFFNSAVVNVNVAFDNIINKFPFDGTKKELEIFQDELTGFENYVLRERFPKYVGYLFFSGTTEFENPEGGWAQGRGTRIGVKDSVGSEFPNFSRMTTGDRVLSPINSSFSIEFDLFVPALPDPLQTGSCQIICQKLSSSFLSTGVPEYSYGWTLALSHSQATNSRLQPLVWTVSSGSAILQASASIERGRFNHVCAVYDRASGVNKLKLYRDHNLRDISVNTWDMGEINFNSPFFYLGSGSAFNVDPAFSPGPETIFTPLNTFSGAIEEFRFFHSTRELSEMKREAKKSIFATGSLRLYFKFNEPTGSYGVQNVVLDSSGFSLHSPIQNFTETLRVTGSGFDLGGEVLRSPLSAENITMSPILFPDHHKVRELNTEMITDATSYDNDNPNLITKLIPPHYLLEGQQFEGFKSELGPVGDPIKGDSLPGSAKLGSAQLLSGLLFTWAKFFDEIKMFIDHFSQVVDVDYDKEFGVADKLLPFLANYYGIELPAFFSVAPPLQFIEGEDIKDYYSRSTSGLKYIQNEIWRRILIDINDTIASKGTIHSIKSVFRSAGINPDTLFRFREYGGPTRTSLENLRVNKVETAAMLDFSGTLAPYHDRETVNSQGVSINYPHMSSSYLSGSHIETGWPYVHPEYLSRNTIFWKNPSLFEKGVFGPLSQSYGPHGLRGSPSDGLWTSGSYTVEGRYRFQNLSGSQLHALTQSLMRLCTTGSADFGGTAGAVSYRSHENNTGPGVVFNLIAYSASNVNTASLNLFGRVGGPDTISRYPAGSFPLLSLPLTGVNIFDGDAWIVSWGRFRGDDPHSPVPSLPRKGDYWASSSYFLRAGKQNAGEIVELYHTASISKLTHDIQAGSTIGNVPYSAEETIEKSSNYSNVSGSFLIIGSQSLAAGPAANTLTYGFRLLNDTTVAAQEACRETRFTGQVGYLRMFSKGIPLESFMEHTRNFKSVGVKDPLVNFNFDTIPSGAFERLRMNVTTDQATTQSADVTIDGATVTQFKVFDFSQNNTHFTARGFERGVRSIRPVDFNYSMLSPYFDEAVTDNKIRIRSLQSEKLRSYNPSIEFRAPLYNLPIEDEPMDNERFSIDFSIVSTLNEDIITIMSELAFFNDALGDQNLLFSESYPEIEQLRKIYFNRLKSKLNFKMFFDFFRWIDVSFTDIVTQLIPRKTKFLGINFIIEPHLLERSKFSYLSYESYLDEAEKTLSVELIPDDFFETIVTPS